MFKSALTFVALPCSSSLNPEPHKQKGAFCPFQAQALLSFLPNSHGPMIDCSLSAFVLGNCFVLLTVCLCSNPKRRDMELPFYTYLRNIFKMDLKLITFQCTEGKKHRNEFKVERQSSTEGELLFIGYKHMHYRCL